MNEQEKFVGLHEKGDRKDIIVTHLTIRQIIFFMLLKLIVIELFSLLTIVAFLYFMPQVPFVNDSLFFSIPILIVAEIIKSIFVFYVIFQWLEESYEITPVHVIHKRGYLIKREDKFIFEHIGSVEIEQGVLGKIFNYGTLKLYNWAKEEFILLYLIHNPIKYYNILKKLVPAADENKKVMRDNLIDFEPKAKY